MKLFTLFSSAALLTVALAADPATTTSGYSPLKTIAEKAAAARAEALAIDGILKAKNPDMAAAKSRADALDQHVADMHHAAQNLTDEKLKASVEVLKVLTENKARDLAAADAKERGRFRATAKNIAMRAEQLVKTSQRIGS
jgi:hypothetical protein